MHFGRSLLRYVRKPAMTSLITNGLLCCDVLKDVLT